MTRESVRETLKENPFVDVLGGLGKGLTPKQKRFAEEIAKGESGSESYRRAYKVTGNKRTQAVQASKLRSNPNIAHTIEAIERANEVMKYQTAEGLRSLAISSLVEVITNPDTSPAVRVQCAKTIGTMTEVSLFTHRTESKVIHSSEDIKAKILKEIGSLMNTNAEDVIARDASSLLSELTQTTEENNPELEGEASENFPCAGQPHPTPTPPNSDKSPPASQHTIPLPQSPSIEDDPLGIKSA